MTRRMRATISGPRYCSSGAVSADALAEGDAGKRAAEVVAPVVIDADDVARLPELVEHEERAAVRAAVLEGVQCAVLVTGHHHRHLTEIRAAIAVGARQLGLEAEEIPGRAAEDARLLRLIDLAVGIDAIGHAGEPFGRPLPRNCVHAHLDCSLIPPRRDVTPASRPRP